MLDGVAASVESVGASSSTVRVERRSVWTVAKSGGWNGWRALVGVSPPPGLMLGLGAWGSRSIHKPAGVM
jgi:hypothetical protein